MALRNPFFVALDTVESLHLVLHLRNFVGGFKVGLGLFTRLGPQAIEQVRQDFGGPLFLDLKLHDIPETVAAAVEASLIYQPYMLTIHHGVRSMRLAALAARGNARFPLIVSIPRLTSEPPLPHVVITGAHQAVNEDGLDGVICSASMVGVLKQQFPGSWLAVVPGIRLPSTTSEITASHVKTASPKEALAAGADILVVGRPVVQADDPVAAIHAFLADAGL